MMREREEPILQAELEQWDLCATAIQRRRRSILWKAISSESMYTAMPTLDLPRAHSDARKGIATM